MTNEHFYGIIGAIFAGDVHMSYNEPDYNNYKLYKFRFGNDRDILALITNRIWVPNIESLNDPVDLSIYYNSPTDKKREAAESIINSLRRNYCLCFSLDLYSQRCWNYYTNAFHGFVIEYDRFSISSLLDCHYRLIDNEVIYDSEACASESREEKKQYPGFSDFVVEYSNKKVCNLAKDIDNVDLSKSFNSSFFLPWKLFFTKDISWAEEKEYRYSFGNSTTVGTNGFYIEGLIPKAIYLGCLMSESNKKIIFEYSQSHNIPIYICSPKYDSEQYEMETKKYEG